MDTHSASTLVVIHRLTPKARDVWVRGVGTPSIFPSMRAYSIHLSQEDCMKNPVTWFGMLLAFSLMLVIGNASFSSAVLAQDSGASSPTIQEVPEAPPDQGGIQERGIRQMPIGGISGGAIGGRLEAVGFSCDAATKT